MNAQPSPWRKLAPGQVCRLRVHDIASGANHTVLETDRQLIEAPNWTLDGRWLIVNADGELFRVAADGGPLEHIELSGSHDANNDHVLDPDGEHIFISDNRTGHILRAPLRGGQADRVTDEADGLSARYLHGVSPDGRTLAHIGGIVRADGAVYNVYTYDWTNGVTTQVTDSDKPHDGSEYSPDGQWLYFNSERASTVPGHSQIFRMRLDGEGVEQLVHSDRVDWFPHLAPDGAAMVYLSYGAGVRGHPADEAVELVVCGPDGAGERARIGLFGGQGTINVNSWAPDSARFAYVEYPIG
ncbi:MAG: hypothetical protein LBD77_09360 [Bifidobacteriaceae bacterium]|jgi:Tol biopolymer transport system component|nr:hypothetical protein [Bifidobacteriaceae bacterium]